MSGGSIPSKLAREVFRKLRLVRARFRFLAARATAANMSMVYQATDAEAKDDREIVCSEVFADVTGSLDDNALGNALQVMCVVQLAHQGC